MRQRAGKHLHQPILALLLVLIPVQTLAQHQTEPHPLDTFLTEILNFTQPTGIRGTVRYIDFDGPVLWLNWKQRSDDSPAFATGWKAVPGEAMLAVHPHASDPIIDFRTLGSGTAVELVIQLDSEGKRRILSFRSMATPPQVPL